MNYNLFYDLARSPAEKEHANALSLMPAAKLYARPEYAQVLKAVGKQNLFICSPGWGITRCDFLLPDYDVSYLSQAPYLIRRGQHKIDWADWNHLAEAAQDTEQPREIHFFVSMNYWPMIQRLCREMPGRKVIHYVNQAESFDSAFEYVQHENINRWSFVLAAEFAKSRARI